MNLILLGPPGAGKGTQAKLIESRFGLKQLSSGDVLRAAVAADTEIGRRAKAFMDEGALVPDDLVLEIVFAHIEGLAKGKGFILDGFPRTVMQAEALDRFLQQRGTGIDRVLEIQVNDELLVRRVAGRFTCASCGEGYNDFFKLPKREGVCDVCGGTAFKRRADDTAETVRNRLAIYHQETRPLVDYYRRGGKVAVIDGERPIDAVAEDIDQLFGVRAS